ncbi:MAG: sigma 54-interacting transcriptional regulator [Desulfomonile tiedjei]|nr:sigma 54-interacting transcriptional regulator [Desulfomonile tiedjei]
MNRARIVVVEDESIIAAHLQEVLTQLGYEVPATASSADEAVEVVGQVSPDLVLMDIVLSGETDGIDAANRIRSRFNVPVLYLTAHAEEQFLERAKASEPLSYILKPYRKEGLRTAIEVALYRSRMERRLQESETRYRELVELLPENIFETDAEGYITYVNRNGLRTFRCALEQPAAGFRLTDVVVPEDRPRVADCIGQVLSGEKLAGLEFTAQRQDGTTFPVIAYAGPITRSNGVVVGTRTVAVDITERKRAEDLLKAAHDQLEVRVEQRTEELAQSNRLLLEEIAERKRAQDDAHASHQLFQAIFESARDSIFVKDRSLRYTLVNSDMAHLLGRPVTELVGLTDEEIFGQEAAEHLEKVDSRVLTGESVEEEYSRLVHGETLTFHDVRVPLRNSAGNTVGLCGISRNITERKRARQRLKMVDEDWRSPAMSKTLSDALSVARTDSLVLLLGESGSGKDYIARWIHDRSRRSNGPFFVLNCAAVAPELAESELFGHEAGAFTGARGRVRGFLELAEGGTLLLNEVGDLPLALQVKLLTFLDTRSFCRVGGRELIKADARLMAATNRDLAREVAERRFRKDLFFRLSVFTLRVPSLRQRPDDIPILVERLVSQIAGELRLASLPEIDTETIGRLCSYSWPGNVRELRNVLERGLILSKDGELNPDVLLLGDPAEGDRFWTVSFPPKEPLPETIKEIRRNFVVEALRRSGGNKDKAARILNISRYTLRRQMKVLDLLACK